jgi:hypothetical protein
LGGGDEILSSILFPRLAIAQEEFGMLHVHTSDGLTIAIDFADVDQTREWIEKMKNPAFVERITGISISDRGVMYSFTKPLGFQRIGFEIEKVEADQERKIKGGERLVCYADDVRITLMVHAAQRAVRVSMVKIGKRRFDPSAR